MFWNYRIVKLKEGYGLYEVYYDDDLIKPFTRTVESTVYGDTAEEVVEVLKMMLKDAKNFPVINDKDIKEENESEDVDGDQTSPWIGSI